MSRKPYVYAGGFSDPFVSTNGQGGTPGFRAYANATIFWGRFSASNQIQFSIYYNKGTDVGTVDFTQRSWLIRVNGVQVAGDNSSSDFLDIFATVPTSGNYSVECVMTTSVRNGAGATASTTASTYFDVNHPSSSSTVNIINQFLPAGGNYLRVLRLDPNVPDGTMMFFKNMSGVDRVAISSHNAKNIDGRNFFIQLASNRGIGLYVASSGNFFITSFYDNALPNYTTPYGITAATYGADTRLNNVVDIIRNNYYAGNSGIFVNNSNMGGDPASGTGKTLTVTYNVNGLSSTTADTPENTTFVYASEFVTAIPQRSPTKGIYLVNVTGGIGVVKIFDLPNPNTSSILMVVGYITNTTAGGRINIRAQGFLGDPLTDGFVIPLTSGAACGVLLVSNGSKWYIVGTFAGANTAYDASSEFRTQQTGSALILQTTGDGCRTPDSTTNLQSGDASYHFCKYGYNQTIPLVINSPNYNTVNSNYKRFYRTGTNDYTCYNYVVYNDAGTYRTIPFTMYPSEY